MTGMKMFKLWMVVMLLGLLPVVSEAQEDINNAINVQLEYLKKYPKDKDALRKVSFLYLNKADYDQAIFYGRQLFEMGYNERDYNGAVIYSHICLGQAHMMKGNVKEAYSHLGQARLIGESNKNDSALCSVYNGLGLYASNVQKTIIVHLPISSKELKLQDVVIMTDSIPFCFLILPVFII